MTQKPQDTERYLTDEGWRVIVQVPEDRAQAVIDAVLAEANLVYGDYDHVTFRSTPGTQSFRSLGTGRNAITCDTVDVPCVEVSFFLSVSDGARSAVLRAIYAAHPYEEPVIFLHPCFRTLHIRGQDEDNPNRFWNRPLEDWVPDAHRG
ncbi:hypothetical protein [Ruegeria arenilitoris]|uniref:hypothetical protein n=1 Tax=Ruegeria arenilitoris TaxID=1173585 RepID=UPI00147A1586|nr:hypothetical protein [Ruegeria arenilitoris]